VEEVMNEQEKAETTLAPYRILDLTDEKGLYCGQLLGSLGADVIKVERPGGDPARNIGPFYHNIPDPEKSLFWFAFNTNKRGITLDIETADGKEIFKKLIRTADVIVESFPPGYMAGLGLGYAELERINPKVIMTSITPFGQTGPYRDYQASDLVAWAMGGLLSMTGDLGKPPVRISHIPFAFLMGGMDGAWSTAAALYWRVKSNEGQHIDVSIQESIALTTGPIHERWEITGEEFQRGGTYDKLSNSDVVLRLVWSAKDGYIRYRVFTGQIGAAENPRLVKWLDDEGVADDFLRGIDWTSFDWRSKSPEEAERIHDYLARFFQSKTTAELFEEGLRRDVMIQPICTPTDILSHPQLEARDYWQELESPELGTIISYPGRFCLLSQTVCKQWRRAPLIGEYNQEIYQEELGLSEEEIIALKDDGII
jgi:crotonobetainyl-CoA:carnitine CoA-transferase CaiB-like acyl-CoA transferase